MKCSMPLRNPLRSTFSLALLTMCSWCQEPATLMAQESYPPASMKLTPIDADFYSGFFRLKEQWDRFVAGPFVAEMMSQPVVENALEQFRSEWMEREGNGGNARIWLENPNAKEAIAFLKNLVASDAFLMGDSNISKWLQSVSSFSEEFQSAMANRNGDLSERAIKTILKGIESIDGLTLPTFVMGARCSDEDLALGKIDQLELAIQAGRMTPQGQQALANLTRLDDNRGNRLQLTLSGKQIPWGEIPTSEQFDEETRDRLQEVIEKKTIVITIGLFDGYFVFAVAPSAKAMLDLGKGKSIADHPDLGTVKADSAKMLTSVQFASDAVAIANFNINLKNFFSRNFKNSLAPMLGSIDKESDEYDFLQDISKDMAWVDDTIGKLIPEPKGTTSHTFLTDTGWEQHAYSRTRDPLGDSTASLAALQHVGGKPLMMVSTRLQSKPEYFQTCRKIVQKFKTRFDEASELDWSKLGSGDDLGQAKEKVDLFWPLLVRFADTFEKKILPSLSGEHTIVLGAGDSAKQWCNEMPASIEPLTMPVLAAVTGVTDKTLLNTGIKEMVLLASDSIELIRKEDTEAVPEWFTLPKPTKTEINQTEKYSFSVFPPEVEVPKDILPQIVFATNYLVSTYSDKQSALLVSDQKLDVGGGVIDINAKQSNASYVHFGKLCELAKPWVRYAMTQSMPSMDESLLDESFEDTYELTGKDLLSFFTVFTKLGEISSTTQAAADGGSYTRSVYRTNQ